MLVKERILASRLILKLDANPDFAKRLGVTTAWKHAKKQNQPQKKKIPKKQI